MKQCKSCGTEFPQEIVGIKKMEQWRKPYVFSILSGVTFCNRGCELKHQKNFVKAFFELPTCQSQCTMDGTHPEGFTEGDHFKYEVLPGEGVYLYNAALEDIPEDLNCLSDGNEYVKASTFKKKFTPVAKCPIPARAL